LRDILLVDGGGWNGVTTVQVNVINFFLNKGHGVAVILFDNGITPDPVKFNRWPRSKRVRYHIIGQHSFLDKLFNKFMLLRCGIKLVKCFSLLRKNQSFYAFEYEAGVILSWYRLFQPSAFYFLHSIELYPKTARSPLIAYAFRQAAKVITQDTVRKQELMHLYGLGESIVLVSINSSRQEDVIDVTPLNFPIHVQERKKVLFIGSLIEEHCFHQVLACSEAIPEDQCLIIHGWGGNKYAESIDRLVKRRPNNVWVSNFSLDDVTKFRLYASIDIGLVTFNADFYNCKFAALSAGKLFDFIRVGKPVIASNIEGLAQFVSETNVGLCIENIQSLYSMTKEIFLNYVYYSKNAKITFPLYEFDLHFDAIYHDFLK
jgi:glycosyltransferase involved in cell wall biosynthesis